MFLALCRPPVWASASAGAHSPLQPLYAPHEFAGPFFGNPVQPIRLHYSLLAN